MRWILYTVLAFYATPCVAVSGTAQQVSIETRTLALIQPIEKTSEGSGLSASKVAGVALEMLKHPYQKAAADDNAFWSHLGISSWISMGIAAALLIYGIVHRLLFFNSYKASGRRRNPSRV